jgi:hypothetical protein
MKTSPVVFDAAIDVLCQFAVVTQKISKSENVVQSMEKYFMGLPFREINDLIYASRIVRLTSPASRTYRIQSFLPFCSSDLGDPVFEACLAVENDAMDQHLEVIWRNPNNFPRDDEFNEELFQRSAKTSFLSFDSAPMTVEEVRQELKLVALRFEESKSGLQNRFEAWLYFVYRPAHLVPGGRQIPVSRRDEKVIKSALKRGEWPQQVAEAFEAHASEIRRTLRHILLWAQRTGEPDFFMPSLSGGQEPRR